MKISFKKSLYQQQKRESIEAKTFDFSRNLRETILSIIIVFCVPVLLFIQTLTFGFTYFDDHFLIKNNITFLRDFHNAPQVFLKDAFLDGSSHFYRPMQTLSYMVDMQLSGENNTWMYHLTNILLLGLIACSLFLFLRKFMIPLRLALLSTLVYCAHPLFVSSIAWIPARGDLQLMLFSLLSFLFYVEFQQKRKIIFLLGNWIAFTIALFCKETAIFLPLIFIIYYLTFPSEKGFEKRYILNIALCTISGIFWFWLREKAIGDFSNRNEVLGMLGHSEVVGLIPVLSNLHTIPESLSSFFIPFDIDPIPDFSFFKTMTGLGIISLISVLFFKNKERSKKEKIFCFSWFLILLLPTMLYKHNIIDYLHHRFFLPLTGILLFVLFLFPKKWFEKGHIKSSLLIIVVFIILSSVTFIKSRSYSDLLTFYNSAISQNSNSDFAYNNRGIIFKQQGLHEKAMSDFTKAIDLNPDYDRAYYNRGTIYYIRGLYDLAIKDFTKAIELKPDYDQAYYDRGFTFFIQGLYDQAINDYTKAINLRPDYALAYNNRGVTYFNQGLHDQAINDFTKAIEFKPDFAEAYNNRGTVYFNQGLTDKSCQDFKKAEELGSMEAKANVTKLCK